MNFTTCYGFRVQDLHFPFVQRVDLAIVNFQESSSGLGYWVCNWPFFAEPQSSKRHLSLTPSGQVWKGWNNLFLGSLSSLIHASLLIRRMSDEFYHAKPVQMEYLLKAENSCQFWQQPSLFLLLSLLNWHWNASDWIFLACENSRRRGGPHPISIESFRFDCVQSLLLIGVKSIFRKTNQRYFWCWI